MFSSLLFLNAKADINEIYYSQQINGKFSKPVNFGIAVISNMEKEILMLLRMDATRLSAQGEDLTAWEEVFTSVLKGTPAVG